jgi:hypothetical protein
VAGAMVTGGIPFREDRVVLLEADTWPDDDDPITFRTIVRWIGRTGLHVELDEPDSDLESARSLVPGSQLFGLYVDGEGVFSFSTAVLGHHPDQPRTLVLQPPIEISQLEPRRYPRIPASLPLEVTVTSAEPPRQVAATMHDLSVSGLRFATPVGLEAGDELDVVVTLDDGPIALRGVIVETRLGRGDGTRWCHVGFSELDDEARRRLDRFTTTALGMRHRGSSLPLDGE